MTRLLPILFYCCLTCSAQQWYAGHFGGWPVPTVANPADVAELPIPVPGANIRLVSTLTTTNSPWLLGDLTGKTITASTWLECSNSPTFYTGNTGGCPNPINMRLFLTSDQRPYTEVHGLQNPTAYWWSNPNSSWSPIACGSNILSCAVTPDGWSDALGHAASDTNYTAAFLNAAQHVAQAGLSFGGGCYYDVGFGIANEGAYATLHVLRYDAQGPSVVTLQAVASDSLDGPWSATGPQILLTTPPAFFKLTITKQP